ncbi:hypothetical protein OAP18_03125 [Gammaproteobacteria bacterium]|nr:hypothetical protein [Gammaproteobacteria bacterium]
MTYTLVWQFLPIPTTLSLRYNSQGFLVTCATFYLMKDFHKKMLLINKQFILRLVIALSGCCFFASAQSQPISPIAGAWVVNEDLSDNTDRQVEIALKAAGQPVRRNWFSRGKDRYRGGPPEQELYDRLSYDLELTIELVEPEFLFSYNDGFQRSVYTDNRSRSVSLNNLDQVADFSFAHWEGDKLLVEARPRDGGFADESYALINDDTQLKVELYIKPRSFQVPIEIIRIYDRKPETE